MGYRESLDLCRPSLGRSIDLWFPSSTARTSREINIIAVNRTTEAAACNNFARMVTYLDNTLHCAAKEFNETLRRVEIRIIFREIKKLVLAAALDVSFPRRRRLNSAHFRAAAPSKSFNHFIVIGGKRRQFSFTSFPMIVFNWEECGGGWRAAAV